MENTLSFKRENEDNYTALLGTARWIKDKFDNLNDLPHEAANTVANIYYRFNLLHLLIEKEENIFEKGCMMEEFISWGTLVKTLPNMIEVTFRSKEIEIPNHIKNTLVSVFIDTYKYRIRNAYKKSGIIRFVERLFKKEKVNEIANLIDIVNGVSPRLLNRIQLNY